MSILYKLATQFGMAQTDLNQGVRLPKGTTTPTIMAQSEDGVLLCYGTTVPTDGATGYSPGCLFLNTTATQTGTALYVNEGSVTSSEFDAVAGA